jgi:branched-chain amino acid transport system substrate-binding protein
MRFKELCTVRKAAAAAAAAAILVTSACSSSSGSGNTDKNSSSSTSSASSASSSTSSGTSATAEKCGAGTGQKATGSPLVFGSIETKQPGIDFTTVGAGIQSYFDCVNDNGGINGHPLQLEVKTEQTNPQQVASLATQLLGDSKVVGIIGNTSLIDCTVNGSTYAKDGIYVIGPAVDNACFSLENYSSVISGPLYSALLAAQYLVTQGGAKGGLVSLESQVPGADVLNSGAIAIGKAHGISNSTGTLQQEPLSNPSAVALQLSQKAGDGGAVVTGLTGPDLTSLLTAASQQGLQNKVHFGCVGLCSDPSVAKALGSAWNGKLAVAADYPPLDSGTPSTVLYRTVTEKYGSASAENQLNEMGFVSAKILVDSILQLPEAQLNRAGINAAIVGIKNYKTDLLCNPWYFGKTPNHVAVDAGWILEPKDGKFVQATGCISDEPVTPQLQAAQKAIQQLGLRG